MTGSGVRRGHNWGGLLQEYLVNSNTDSRLKKARVVFTTLTSGLNLSLDRNESQSSSSLSDSGSDQMERHQYRGGGRVRCRVLDCATLLSHRLQFAALPTC